jgi:hypothetical protein
VQSVRCGPRSEGEEPSNPMRESTYAVDGCHTVAVRIRATCPRPASCSVNFRISFDRDSRRHGAVLINSAPESRRACVSPATILDFAATEARSSHRHKGSTIAPTLPDEIPPALFGLSTGAQGCEQSEPLTRDVDKLAHMPPFKFHFKDPTRRRGTVSRTETQKCGRCSLCRLLFSLGSSSK